MVQTGARETRRAGNSHEARRGQDRVYGAQASARCPAILFAPRTHEAHTRKFTTYSGETNVRTNLGKGLVHTKRLALFERQGLFVHPCQRTRHFALARTMNAHVLARQTLDALARIVLEAKNKLMKAPKES